MPCVTLFAETSETLQIWTLVVGSVVPLLIMALQVWSQIMMAKIAATQKTQDAEIKSVATKLETVRHATNSMKDELVEEVRAASFAKGVKAEAEKDTK